LRFPGQYFDEETGLHWNFFRDYNPSTGRYLEKDPIGLRGGINVFAYVQNNPAKLSDPFGLTTYMCTKPLHALGGSGDRSGPDVPGNLLYHQFFCVFDSNGKLTYDGQDLTEGDPEGRVLTSDKSQRDGWRRSARKPAPPLTSALVSWLSWMVGWSRIKSASRMQPDGVSAKAVTSAEGAELWPAEGAPIKRLSVKVSWLLTSPSMAHGVGSKDVDNRYKCWVERLPIRPCGSANPYTGFTAPASYYVNILSGINGTWSRMM